jgi:drug/metabolite transporter (DMT)-like permease
MYSSGLYSVKSDLLTKEHLIEKRKNEQFAYIIGILSQLVWALNSIQIKTYEPWFPGTFSNNSLLLWRSIPIWILGFYFCKKKNIRIIPVSEIHYKFWFFFRSLGNYVGVYLWVRMFSYLRVSTGQVITNCFPIVVVFLSVIYLHETFYYRYIVGIFICLIGSGLIVLNENKAETKRLVVNDNIFAGIMFSLAHLLFEGLSCLGQKIMCKEYIQADLQNYYLGMYNTLPAFLLCIYERHFGISDIKYVLYAMSNGIFLFYLANYLQTKSLEYLSSSKFMPITYMCIVFIFIFGFLLLGETVYFTDILGGGLIIGFQVYNYIYPPGKSIDEDDNNQQNEENANKNESNIIIDKLNVNEKDLA